ncbi:MAG: glycosyl hydrolase [Clostridiales bacterium]|nr:glycosyl hydrolase [Clostridiales bacterium]
MNFQSAVETYRKNPVNECLCEVTDALLGELTLDEKLRLLHGRAMGKTVRGVLTAGRVYNQKPYPAGGCKRLGIPAVCFADGPRGVVLDHGTCFPVSMLRGATFDDELEYRVGEVFAKECIAGGANYFAGICINLLRHPAWGRAQETYGEDPYLLGRMGVALTKAVQSYGVIACPKHFALNSIEDLRFSVDARVDERTLREVYLPHFKACVDAGAMSIMGAYNRVNGTYCCENSVLLNDILRGEWGFDGFTISDFFFGVYDAARSLRAGLDIEMPYFFRYTMLKAYLKKGKISESDINTAVRRILGVLIRTTPLVVPQSKSVVACKEHTALAREVADKGTVLLKNNGILPLAKDKKIGVVGRYAEKANTGDHGSSNVFSPYVVTPYEGLSKAFGKTSVRHYNGCDTEKARAAVRTVDTVIVCVGSDHKQEGEFLVNVGKVNSKAKNVGGDRQSLRIPEEDVALIKAMADSGKRVIVNIMGGSAYIIDDWSDYADAVLMSFYSGLEGGNALADVVTGAVCPSGRLPFTIAKREEDYPPFVRIGDRKYDIEYGYYHGYTLFEKEKLTPAYAFGFGLSYTSFELSGFKAKRTQDGIAVTVKVKNTGKRAGAQVVQVYAGSADGRADRPVKLLKGFKRIELEAGESAAAELLINTDELKFYNPETKAWELDTAYNIFAGSDCEEANSRCVKVKMP